MASTSRDIVLQVDVEQAGTYRCLYLSNGTLRVNQRLVIPRREYKDNIVIMIYTEYVEGDIPGFEAEKCLT